MKKVLSFPLGQAHVQGIRFPLVEPLLRLWCPGLELPRLLLLFALLAARQALEGVGYDVVRHVLQVILLLHRVQCLTNSKTHQFIFINHEK